MATFKAFIRTQKEYNTVYIRIIHHSKTAYIKTEMMVHQSKLKKGEITDFRILVKCAAIIKQYVDKINHVNIKNWTIHELKKYLMEESQALSFSAFEPEFIEIRIIHDDGTEELITTDGTVHIQIKSI